MHIMIVEDERESREGLGAMLLRLGSDRADVAGGLRGRSDEAACGPSRRSDLPGHPHAGHGTA